jgi:hypothetical protein
VRMIKLDVRDFGRRNGVAPTYYDIAHQVPPRRSSPYLELDS